MIRPTSIAPDVCADCVEQSGLCTKHAEQVCPRLAINVGWLKLMGEAHTEQKARQSTAPLPVSPQSEAHQERKRRARRPKVRGIKALAHALLKAA